MTESLRNQISLLRQLTPQLNAVTDDSARLVDVIEKFLNDECQFGIPADAVISRYEHPDGTEGSVRLEYGKIDGKFKLIVTEIEDDPYGQTRFRSRMAWASCARDVKLGSFQHIPALLEEISKKIQRTIEETKLASKTVEALLQAIGAGDKKGGK